MSDEFFSMSETVSVYFLNLCNSRTNTFSKRHLPNLKFTLSLIKFSKAFECIVTDQDKSFLSEIFEFLPADIPEYLLNQVLELFESIRQPDRNFFNAFFNHIRALANLEDVSRMVRLICRMGSERVGKLQGSDVADFLVMLSNNSLSRRDIEDISDALIKLPRDSMTFTSRVFKQLMDNQSAADLFISCLCKSQISVTLFEFHDIISWIILNISKVLNLISKNKFSMIGSTELTIADLAESVLGLSRKTILDLSEILSDLPCSETGFKEVSIVLLAHLQFKAVVPDPQLRMFPLSQINLEEECLIINYAEQLGLQHRTASFQKQNNQVHLNNKWTDLTNSLTKAIDIPEDSLRPRKPLLVQGDPGTEKAGTVVAWCMHHAITKSVAWISFNPNGKISLAIMRQGYIFYADGNSSEISEYFIISKNYCTLIVIDGVSKQNGKEAIKAAHIWLKQYHPLIERSMIAITTGGVDLTGFEIP
jgi:hypothetical protein